MENNPNKKNKNFYYDKHTTFQKVFFNKYISIVELDLYTGKGFIIKSEYDSELEGSYIKWEKILERYVSRRVYYDDREIIFSLTLKYMEKELKNNCKEFPIEIRCLSNSEEYNWVQIEAFVLSLEERKILITTLDINQDKIIRHIIELFVYKNFDYIILLNTKHNSYTRLSGNKDGVPIPLKFGDNYTADMIEYNKKYIVSEDIDYVTKNMQIDNIIKNLENFDTYSFSSGGIKEDGTYRRTRLQFTYYDKKAGLVIISRVDVTQIYLEEQAKNAALLSAMQAATLDTLTGIYNQKAINNLISQSLENQYHTLSAFLFIDVDNFKMVNDTLGHQEGDKLLCFLAKFLKNTVGKNGIAGRIGGDEFLLFLPSISNIDIASEYAKKICKAFDKYTNILSKKLPVTCSIGISLYPYDGTDCKILIRKADQALYTSKRYGKNQYVFYSENKK